MIFVAILCFVVVVMCVLVYLLYECVNGEAQLPSNKFKFASSAPFFSQPKHFNKVNEGKALRQKLLFEVVMWLWLSVR